MSFAAKPTTRRTLPAPSEVVNVEELIAERDRLRSEREELFARLEARETAAREAVFLMDEVARLRDELANMRSAQRTAPPRDQELPPFPPQPALPRAFASGLGPQPSSRVVSQARGSSVHEPGETPSGGPREAAPLAGMGLDFGTVSRLSPTELDKLPYGLICLDAQGRVVHYNDTESRLAQLPKERVVGRNFFTDVAPCARVREFEGEFQELVRDASRVRVRSFDFVFRFRHSEQHVTIVMTPARQRGLYNVALLRRSITPRTAE